MANENTMYNMSIDNPGLPLLPPSPHSSWPRDYQPEDNSLVNLSSRHNKRTLATIGHVVSFPIARPNGHGYGLVQHFLRYEHMMEVASSTKGKGNPTLTHSISRIYPPSSPQEIHSKIEALNAKSCVLHSIPYIQSL